MQSRKINNVVIDSKLIGYSVKLHLLIKLLYIKKLIVQDFLLIFISQSEYFFNKLLTDIKFQIK